MVTFFPLSRWSKRLITFTLGCLPLGKRMVYVRAVQLNIELFSAPPRAKFILQYSSAVKVIMKTI
jgi:hypothetical protein